MTASLYQVGSEVFGTAVIELLIRGSAASLPCSCARGRSAHVVLASVMMFHAKDVAWLAPAGGRKHEPIEVYRIPLHDPSPTLHYGPTAQLCCCCRWAFSLATS